VLSVVIPGFRPLRLEHLLLDFNGTIALDGHVVPGVLEAIHQLSGNLSVHVVTADTFGTARAQLALSTCRIVVLGPDRQDHAKAEQVRALGADAVAAIGNGRNDRLMLAEAALGIAVIGPEGASTETLAAADVVVGSPVAALELLLHPQRLIATLRS
jgi:soluble P-type ATPase